MENAALTVSQLNRSARTLLEQGLGQIRVQGEISNLGKPGSGHLYFTLKDAHAQIRCAFFRNSHTRDTSRILDEGLEIIASGRVSLYEPRGDYQLIVSHVESAGEGLLYRQFCILKAKLEALGLFEDTRKRALPKLPQTIGIITSPGSAALQDMLSTLRRRFPLACVVVYASEVQGQNAPAQLMAALALANHRKDADVLLLARGGGSMEDLWAFNHEQLAHAIASSEIPVISGVGHETDFTIADFVADLRAATPTAAAEAATPCTRDTLLAWCTGRESRLVDIVCGQLRHHRMVLDHAMARLTTPTFRILHAQQRLENLLRRCSAAWHHQHRKQHASLHALKMRLLPQHPATRLAHARASLGKALQALHTAMQSVLNTHTLHQHALITRLETLSPLATLERGYAIALHRNKVLLSARAVHPGDRVHIRLMDGTLDCVVERTSEIP